MRHLGNKKCCLSSLFIRNYKKDPITSALQHKRAPIKQKARVYIRKCKHPHPLLLSLLSLTRLGRLYERTPAKRSSSNPPTPNRRHAVVPCVRTGCSARYHEASLCPIGDRQPTK
uniref:Uncharacterized protein n=1 Tax=Trypanosoma vivax (strain Y486) TaxID=1055687 RepID=G0UAT4_TRYVY|nr:hypothetical protein, unlikely [Trypanosoma vivax Y486]